MTPGPYCAAHRHRADGLYAGRDDRLEHLQLLIAHAVRLKRGRGLHGDQREQLQHVVLHEIAQRPGVLVVPRPTLDSDVLRRGDLDVVDEVAVPNRLEQGVGEPERHEVLDGLLAEVVVDPEDLRLLEDLEHPLVQLAGRGQVVPERLLDHDPGPRFRRPMQTGGTKLLADDRKELRRGREVEQSIQLITGLLVEFPECAVDLAVDVVVVERTRQVAQVPEQPVEHVRVWAPA